MNTVRLASTLGTAFLLASLLGPRAFGAVALALIFITLVQLLIQQGITPAIVQRPGLTWRHLDSAFWMAMGISIVLAGVTIVVSPIWAGVNGTPEAKGAIWALSSLIVIRGAMVVQEGYLQRSLKYRELAVRTTAASLCGAVVGVVWAIVSPSIWALVAQQIVAAVVAAIVIWGIAGWRPRLRCRARDVGDLMGFALKSTLSSLGVFVNTRVDAVLVGLYFGATAIGLYQLAFRLVQSAVETTVNPIAGVALADLSRLEGSGGRERVADRYVSLVGLSAVLGAPVVATVFACAGPLMALVGPEWADAVPALRLLCIVGLATAVGMVNSPALQAVGRPGAQAALVWTGGLISAATFVTAGALLVGADIQTQVVGMAASRAVVYAVILLPVSQALIGHFVGVSARRFVRTIGPPVLMSCLACAVGLLVQVPLRTADAAALLQLFAAGTVTLLVAIPLLLLSSPSARLVAARLSPRRAGGRFLR